MAPRRYVHIEMIVPYDLGFDIMSMCDGKATNLNIRPVKHGGEDENGELKPKPTAREFIMAYVATQNGKEFSVAELKNEARRLGANPDNIAQQVVTITNEGVLKRIATGVYQERGAAKKKSSPLAGRISPPKEGTQPAAILAAVRKKQNGSGDGVTLDMIREVIGVKKDVNISPAVTSLVKRGFLTRIAAGHYRVEG